MALQQQRGERDCAGSVLSPASQQVIAKDKSRITKAVVLQLRVFLSFTNHVFEDVSHLTSKATQPPLPAAPFNSI